MKRKPVGLRELDRSIPWQSKPHRFFYWFCAACLALYLAYAAYLSRSDLFRSTADTFAALGWFAVIACAALFALVWVSGLRGGVAAPEARGRLSGRVFLLASALSAVILAVYLMASYPGGVSVDSAVQWTQAATARYSNWHPVFHTLLIRLMFLIRPDYAFAVAAQCVLVSLGIGYLVATLSAWGFSLLPLLLAEALAVASPLLGHTLMYLWKDNAMTLGVTLLFAQTVNVYFSRGAWLARRRNALALGFALAFTTLVRHNAILFTLPLLITLAFCYRARLHALLSATAALVVTLALVWGPLYASLNVTYPSNGLEESIGLPMTVISNLRKTNPGALDAETRALTDAMADDAGWEAYQLNNYNSIKFGATREAIAHRTLADILRMTASAVKADPRGAFLAVNGVTDLVWGLADAQEAVVTVHNSGDLPSVPQNSGRINRVGSVAEAVIAAPLSLAPVGWFFNNLGVSMAAMLVLALRAIRRNGVSVLALCLPVLLYNLGTMCVLCGNDARFFAYSPLICLMALFVLARDLPGLPLFHSNEKKAVR